MSAAACGIIYPCARRDLQMATSGKVVHRVALPRAICDAPKLQSSIPNFSQIFQPNHQTLEGSFSAVSTPIFASKYSFCSVFRNLQDCHTFAPLEAQNLCKFLSNFFTFLLKFQQKSRFFSKISSNFAPILMKFSQNFDEYVRTC